MNNITIIVFLLTLLFSSFAFAQNLILSTSFETGYDGLTVSEDTPSGTAACSSVCTERSTTLARTGSYSAIICNGSVTDGFLQIDQTMYENDEIYIKYYQYFPTATWSWAGISSTGMKQIRAGAGQGDGWPINTFKTDSIDPHTHGYYSEATDPLHPEEIPERTFFKNIEGWPEGNNFPATGSWHKVEMYFKWSNSGGYWWKIDGYLVAGSLTVAYDVWPPPWGSTIANVRFAGGNGMPDTNGFYYVDDVEIWDGIPTESEVPSTVNGGITYSGASFY